MPHMPDSHHDTHDLELVAAYAAGDATGADLETATALVASCTDCAALHHDLRAIAAAMPTIPAPVRPRDFRLTPEQAASLRPGGLRGLVAALASPRLSFATPLGTGLAALGLVGVLVASGGLPLGAGTSGGTAAQDTGATMLEAPAEMGAAGASAAPAAELVDPSLEFKSEVASPDIAGERESLVQPAASAPPDVQAQPEMQALPAADDTSDSGPMLALGLLLVFVGSALVAARLVGRRLARAP